MTHHFTPEAGAPVRRWEALIERLSPLGFEFGVLAPPPHHASGKLIDPAPQYRPGRVSTGPRGERIVRTCYRAHSTGLLSRTRDQVVAAASAVPLGLRHFRHRSTRPHIVIGTVPGIPSMFAAWALARLLGAKYVVEMRDAWPDLIAPSGMLGTSSRLGVRRRLRLFLTRMAHRSITRLQSRADLVVTTTETFGAVLRERGQRSVAVVRNGTKLPMATHEFDTPRADAGASDPLCQRPPDRPGVDRPLRALYLGTIGRAQSLDCVVKAAAIVAQRGHKLEVRIVGRGAHTARVRHLARRLEAPVSVETPVPHDEALELYRWADTAVIALHGWGPFEWTIPSKVYEVMARGTTVTAALAGEAADLVRDHGAGVVVEPDNPEALAGLWCSWCEAGAVPPVSPDAARWVEEHATWDVLAEEYARVLGGLAAS
ncbi:glycosyltransferase family 4 protein [Xylanimonas ulmi]|uniref:glycosyltransferase family 4 protein n=1 Tax=Xylanimonas ulmi TaxID=228973 RepID=UPI0013EE993B|nr:glycosyltransferase family 4 protein [Xylanibacterium ulmi]